MVVGDRAPAHQRRDYRHVDGFGEAHQQIARVGVDDAAARDDQRPLGCVEHRDRLFDLGARRSRLVGLERLIAVDVELDLRHLHVERQIDQHGARTTRAHQVECVLKNLRHLARFAHRHRPFGDRLGNRFDVDRLKVFLVQPRARRLAGDAQNRNRIGACRIEPGDHVGAGRTRRADAHADVARDGAGVALGHMRSALDVPREDVRDRALFAQRRVERIDRGAGHAEGLRHAFFFHHQHGSLGCGHLCHFVVSSG